MFESFIENVIDSLKWEYKHFMSKFTFYRRWKGGIWYKVRPTYDLIYGEYWIHNRRPLFNEYMVKREVYLKK